MRQRAAQSAPTSLHEWDNCIFMLIIVNRIQFSYYSSYIKYRYLNAQNKIYPDNQDKELVQELYHILLN